MKFASLFIVLSCASVCLATSFINVNNYAEHDNIDVFVNTLTSSKVPVHQDYYSLPVCKPDSVNQIVGNIGTILSGEYYSNTPLSFKMKEDKTYPQIICKMQLTQEDVNTYISYIKDEFNIQWVIDDLPAASVVTIGEGEDDFWYEDTYPLGFITENDKHAVYNHLAFTISYHKTTEGKYRIVGVRVAPASIDYVENEGKLMARSKNSHMILEKPTDIIYTYSIMFEESEFDYGSRWDVYLYGNTKQGVHWFSLTNSIFMVLFLSTIVGIIIIRTLSRDINKYNAISEEERIETVEEGGWKLIHGDVFRPPKGAELFAGLVGIGAQILFTCIAVILLAAAGILSPAHRGSIGTAIIVIIILMGFVAGYSSARLNLYFGGKNRSAVTAIVSLLVPGCVSMVILFINILLKLVIHTTYLSLASYNMLLFMWILVTVPLTFLGSALGYKLTKYNMPVRTNHIERDVPLQPWYLHPALTCIVGGCVPFGTMFLELYFVVSSILLHQTYAVFGFLLAILILTLITTAEISIVICYFQLTNENYHWWWSSFFNTGFTGVIVFLFAIIFYSRIAAHVYSFIVFASLMLLVGAGVFLAWGSIGFYTCFWFARAIYGSLKVD